MTKHRHGRRRAAIPGGATGLPIVAIVGRPNVGKSTLFNRLVRARFAIVDDVPGVTRDRHYADTDLSDKPCTMVDTGGLDLDDADPMKVGVAEHVRAAIREADAILFVTDATTEPNESDRAALKLLRTSGKPVVYAANKADSPRIDADAFELYRLGVDKVFPVSALHGRGIRELESAIADALPTSPQTTALAAWEGAPPPRIALVGRPNAGKSSLLNRVLGENRVLVDERPGTTHDAIDALVAREGKRYVFIDTAGIRRKARVARETTAIESLSVLSSIRAIERAHVVVALCDATEGVAEQDAKVLGLAEERGRAMVVALSKADRLSKADFGKAEKDAREKLSFMRYVPLVATSAKTGRGVTELFTTIDRVLAAFWFRAPTGELNRFFEQVLEQHPPPIMRGRSPRLYYVTQAQVAPPTFVAMTNAPDAIHVSYSRYVVNQLRQRFGFEGTPVRMLYKARRRRERN